MADNLKSLAKDTAIYGVSSILGRILNWCLTPLHVYIFTNPVEYGKVNQLYGFTAVSWFCSLMEWKPDFSATSTARKKSRCCVFHIDDFTEFPTSFCDS